jgi:hypothetical protein
MRCLFVIASQNQIRDADTNNISIINILETVSSEEFPFAFGPISILCVTIREEGDPETATLTLEFSNNENVITTHPVDIGFQGRPRNRLTINLGSLRIIEPGILTIRVKDANKKELTRYIINVNLIGQKIESVS